MAKIYKKLEEVIDRKIRRKKEGKRVFRDLKTATSLGWIFITPIVMSIFLGNYIKKFFSGYEISVMIVFILLGVIFSCINIIYVIKNLCKRN